MYKVVYSGAKGFSFVKEFSRLSTAELYVKLITEDLPLSYDIFIIKDLEIVKEYHN